MKRLFDITVKYARFNSSQTVILKEPSLALARKPSTRAVPYSRTTRAEAFKALYAIASFCLALFVLVNRSNAGEKPKIEEGTKQINGVALYYKTIGEGEPIVILHGGPGLDHSYFLPQMERLAKSYKLIFFDQRASGRSSAPKDSTGMTLDHFIADIDGVRQAFGLEKMHLMAHSWGGLLAMNYALKHSAHLKSLILVNSVSANSADRALADKNLQSRYTRQDSLDRAQVMQRPAFQMRDSKALAEFFKIVFRPAFYDRKFAKQLTLAFQPDYVKKSAMLQYLSKDLATYNLHAQLATLKVSALIIHGEADPLPVEAAAQLHESLKGSEFVLLKYCGHFPFIEAPQDFVVNVKSFLNRLPE
ncbi:alpha/beta fold hydrolase [candidate division KSB1 bacterium]|nr:alpha/beta fold hydrolase [candidate division KSB1 bacterium]